MKIYTLKATKSRSNPQVIREFQIDGRRPVADLLAMLDLLFGSNISQYAVFTQGEQIFHDLSVPIEKVFTKQPLRLMTRLLHLCFFWMFWTSQKKMLFPVPICCVTGYRIKKKTIIIPVIQTPWRKHTRTI